MLNDLSWINIGTNLPVVSAYCNEMNTYSVITKSKSLSFYTYNLSFYVRGSMLAMFTSMIILM